ncbi:MAG TPA: hypothetical protein VMS77_07180 [Conexivisphaerales archaeon]|nr:hypothetical protein [Conexivisphaerales archaeon]
MNEKRGSVQFRRLAKPVAFVAVILLLFSLSRVTVAYTPMPKGATALPADMVDKVLITSINGGAQSVYDESTGGDTDAQIVGVQTWAPSSNTLVVSPQVSTSGCQTEFKTSVVVTFMTANRLSVEEKGSVNVSVFNNKNGQKLDTYIVPMDFKPGAPASGSAHFDLTVNDDGNPAFLVKITFPTASDLANGLPLQQVSLFEFLLYKAGVLSP